MTATTAATLPESSLELDDDMPDDDCTTCGASHDDDLHSAVLGVRRWLKADVTRRLTLAPTVKKFQRRPGGKLKNTPVCVPRASKMAV